MLIADWERRVAHSERLLVLIALEEFGLVLPDPDWPLRVERWLEQRRAARSVPVAFGRAASQSRLPRLVAHLVLLLIAVGTGILVRKY